MTFTEPNQASPNQTGAQQTPVPLHTQVDTFDVQVENLQAMKRVIRKAIPEWEHTLRGKSELTDAQKKQLRSAIRVAKRETAIPDKPKPSTPAGG